jgi:hypothetical protein
MGSTAETLDKARALVEKRLAEIEDERKELKKTLRSLGSSGKGRPGRPKGSGRRRGARSDQAVRLISANPGITISELGRKMQLKTPHYLYRLLPDLEKSGKVR